MGDISPVSISDASPRQPGMMLVRPSLHKETNDNAETFKRWTIMHFRDLLNCPPASASSPGISRTLRYTSSTGDLLYTIHTDNVAIWKTKAYYDISRRLDLENTRIVEASEETVLQERCGYTEGSMVWDVCNAEFAILSASVRDKSGSVESYHDLPLTLLSPAGASPTAPSCSLVTLTYTSSTIEEELPKHLAWSQDRVVSYITSTFGDRVDGKVYATTYRHLPDAQPNMHPLIAEGKHGNGSWVVCVFVQADLSDEDQLSLEAQIEEDTKTSKSKEITVSDSWSVKVGVWKGEVFMA